MGAVMFTLNVIGLGIIVIFPLIAYVIITIHLTRKITFLENFIMVQKDIMAFNRISSKQTEKKGEDKKKEKEAKEYEYYMKIVNSGVCDEKDVDRFGVVTVDQG